MTEGIHIVGNGNLSTSGAGFGGVQEFVCITPPNPRKLDAEKLAQYLTEAGTVATPCQSVMEGVKTAMEKAGSDGVVLCFGSLYSIGSIRDALEEIEK